MSFKIWLVYFSALAFLFVSSSHFLVLCWLSVFPLWGTYSCLWCYFHNSCIRVILALVPVIYLFHANWEFPGFLEEKWFWTVSCYSENHVCTSGSYLNSMETVGIVLSAVSWPGWLQTTRFMLPLVDCGSRLSSAFSALQCRSVLPQVGATPRSVWA